VPLLYASLNTTLGPKTTTDSSGAQVCDLSSKVQHSWYDTIDKKHTILLTKYKMKFFISLFFFERDPCTAKSDTFHG
jgi:hypothetical protein